MKIAFFLIMVTQLLLGEVSYTSIWLMNERASLFDLGMLKTRITNRESWIPQLLDQVDSNKLHLNKNITDGMVVYHLRDDTIIVGVYLLGKPSRDLCIDTLLKYKEIIISKKLSISYRHSILAKPFLHDGYSMQNQPENINEELSKRFIFKVEIAQSARFNSARISCSTTVDTDSVSYIEMDGYEYNQNKFKYYDTKQLNNKKRIELLKGLADGIL